MRVLALRPAGAALALALAAAGARGERELGLVASLEPELELAGFELADLDGEPGDELLLVGAAGELVAYGRRGAELAARGATRLADPARALVDLAQAPGGPWRVVAAGPGGIVALDLRAGSFGEPAPLARRARFELRTGRPVLADIVQDVNGDGLFDVVLPGPRSCELWLAEPAPAAGLRRAAVVAVDVDQASWRDAERLSNTLWSSFVVPRLATRDVNGDGRGDLCVARGATRAFHLQRPDGSFPEAPDVALDLALFRDTTPEATGLRPGRTLALADQTRFEARDLDRDGIEDHVIAHRRKVWVFHGGKDGPQFARPANVLKAADDVTALVLAELDGDGYPDLLLFKIQVPSVAALIRALFAEWQVAIGAAGYRNLEGRAFDTEPAWKSEIELRLPAILSVMKDPERLLERFRELGRAFRAAAEGDVDGDGAPDVALVSQDGRALQLWRGRAADARAEEPGGDAILRRLFFEEPDKSWDVDRVLGWIASLAARRVERLTAGRAADVELALRDPGAFELKDLAAADLDGDGRDELVLRYAPRSAPHASAFDVLGTR